MLGTERKKQTNSSSFTAGSQQVLKLKNQNIANANMLCKDVVVKSNRISLKKWKKLPLGKEKGGGE